MERGTIDAADARSIRPEPTDRALRLALLPKRRERSVSRTDRKRRDQEANRTRLRRGNRSRRDSIESTRPSCRIANRTRGRSIGKRERPAVSERPGRAERFAGLGQIQTSIGSGERRAANGDRQLERSSDRAIDRCGDRRRRTIEHRRDSDRGRNGRRIETTDGTVVVGRGRDQERRGLRSVSGRGIMTRVVMVVTRRTGLLVFEFASELRVDDDAVRARDGLVTGGVIMMPMPERTDGGGTAEDRQHQPAGCPEGQPFHRNERLEIEGRPTNDDSHCRIRTGQETGSTRRDGFPVRSHSAGRRVAKRSPSRQPFRHATRVLS